MKKVLFIYHVSAIGGGSYCLLNILKEIDRTYFEPYVLLSHDGPLVQEIQKLGIDVRFLSNMRIVPYNESTFTPKKIINATKIISSFKNYKRILKDIKPDLVYVNTMMLYPYLRIAKSLGIKTLIHIREHWPKSQHRIQRKIAVNHIHKYADAVVAISHYSASMIESDQCKVTIVHDWIDLSSRYKPIPFEDVFKEDCSSKRVYVYMGGLQPVKGPLQVIKGFSESVDDENSRLLILGINPNMNQQGLRGKIKKTLTLLGYKTFSTRIIEAIDKDWRIKCMPNVFEVKDIYKQAYCLLSFFTIPHANLALAESIICGTINIAAKTSESLEYSLDGKLANLYEFGNTKEFSQKIRELPKVHNELSQTINENKHLVSQLFDKKINNDILTSLLKELLIVE